MEFEYPTAFSSWTPNDNGPEDRAFKCVYATSYLTMGPETEAFEHEIAQYHGRKHAIATNSGSSANLVAVAALCQYSPALRYEPDFPAGALVPAIAWATTYAPLIQHQFQLEIADIDATWNAACIGSAGGSVMGAKLHVACSVLGSPANLSLLKRTAEIQDAYFLEDNCESLGARTPEGRLTGTFGDLSTGSGFYSHQLSAIELGWILTNDDELARLCRLLMDHGNDGWQSDDFDHSYNFTLFGYNLRAAELNCAVAREQLRRLEPMIQARRDNLSYFNWSTENLSITLQRVQGTPSPFGLAFCVDAGNTARRRLATNLRAAGIDCRLPTGGSFLKHPYSKPWQDQSTPIADRIHDTGMFCGNAPYPISHLIDKLVSVIKETL